MQEISHHCVSDAAATPLLDDIAVWILVSADADSDPQVVNHPKERQPTSNACWRPALLVRNIVVMEHMVDFRYFKFLASKSNSYSLNATNEIGKMVFTRQICIANDSTM